MKMSQLWRDFLQRKQDSRKWESSKAAYDSLADFIVKVRAAKMSLAWCVGEGRKRRFGECEKKFSKGGANYIYTKGRRLEE